MFTYLETLVVSLAGGLAFYFIHMPLPWMLGPLVVTLIWRSVLKRQVSWPVTARDAGLVVIGYAMGITFTHETVRQILMQLPTMIFATIITVSFSLLMGYITCRQTGISLSSGLIGSVPGGLSQMVVLSEEIPDCDITVVTFMQTVRLLSVVFVIPFLAIHGLAGNVEQTVLPVSAVSTGSALDKPWIAWLFLCAVLISAWVAYSFRLPTPFLLGPVLGSAALVLNGFAAPALPDGLIIAAQLCVGIYMGVSIKPASLKNWQKLLPYTVCGVVGVVACSLGIGFLLSHIFHFSLVTAFLSTAPGGMTEMGLTAMMIHANLSVIIAYQMFRLLFILLCVPPLLKWRLGRAAAKVAEEKAY